MLFTTGSFVCVFLPTVLAVFFAIGHRSQSAAAAWLFLASLFFYGYWMPEFTGLLVASIVANFLVGSRIGHEVHRSRSEPPGGVHRSHAKTWLILGVAGNLLLLAYFKYANFFLANLDAVLGKNWNLAQIVLPIGISFFTFTQIAFLADGYQKGVREYKFIHYGLFVTYFPHLIAGPVLHHSQMMPQFADARTYRFNRSNFTVGLALFALGLIKKVVLADGISPYADAVFNAADAGHLPSPGEAWLGAVAYTLQLYFDFSGYSDMAVGLSMMFNVQLPYNFDSPYRSLNISAFWRRWHITLSDFLRDYLYIALGGNRKGRARRYVNLAITMLLGGLWHGASWSFVVWGGLHGLFLILHQGFRSLCGTRLCDRLDRSPGFNLLSWALTMLFVVLAWVFFRSVTLDGAGIMLRSMAGQGSSGHVDALLWDAGLHFATGCWWCGVLAIVAVLPFNSKFIGTRLSSWCRGGGATHGVAVLGGASVALVLFMVLLNTTRDAVSAFIYFNF